MSRQHRVKERGVKLNDNRKLALKILDYSLEANGLKEEKQAAGE